MNIKTKYLKIKLAILLVLIAFSTEGQNQTYAEKLGFPRDARVLILHVDDVGMSWDSNEGAIQALEKGVANSLSIMMPCPWVPGFVHYMKEHPNIDAGLHLTLTSEWRDYRWGPLSGKSKVPGLVDSEGAFWSSVEDVIKNATPDEVEAEIRAQIERAKTFGFNPTHLDSHMGTLFAKPEFLQRYIKVGVENKIPVMFPGGHNTMILKQTNGSEQMRVQMSQAGQMLWNSGFPVLDDLHNLSYGFEYKAGMTEDEHRKFATSNYIETIRELKPGLTMVIMHCTKPSEVFAHITDSGMIRKGDLLAMTDPVFKKFLEQEKIILTTWREVMERRSKVK
jgi:chitin disaccharide deacetylase